MQSIKFTSGNSKIPQGVHIGTLIQIIDIGIQPSYVYEGKVVTGGPKLLLTFEFPNIKNQEGTPATQTFNTFFSTTLGSKLNLYTHALLGGTEEATKQLQQELAFMQILGKSAQIQIGKADSEKAKPKIVAMMPLPAGIPHPEPSVIPTFFDMDKPDVALFESFKDWIQKAIMKAENIPEILKNLSSQTFAAKQIVTQVIAPTAVNF